MRVWGAWRHFPSPDPGKGFRNSEARNLEAALLGLCGNPGNAVTTCQGTFTTSLKERV